MIEEKILTESQKNAKIALSNRLFVNGWCLNEDLHDIIDKDCKHSIVELHYDGDKPVGVAVYHAHYIQVFVRAKYRRSGIGSQLVEKIKNKVPRIKNHGTGIVGSDEFWQKVLQNA